MAQAKKKAGKDDESDTALAAMSFEAAMGELEGIVDRLERGEATLEESIALYERGVALKAHCEGKLRSAEARIEKVVQAAGGSLATEPLDGDAQSTAS